MSVSTSQPLLVSKVSAVGLASLAEELHHLDAKDLQATHMLGYCCLAKFLFNRRRAHEGSGSLRRRFTGTCRHDMDFAV